MQTEFNEYPSLAQAGLLADNGPTDMVSRAAEGGIAFGRLCVLGTDVDKQVKLPAASGDVTGALKNIGVSVLEQDYVLDPTLIEPGLVDKDALDCLRKGRMYVKVEEAVTPESTVYARFAALGQISVLTFDVDFVTSNTIDLKVNGVSITQVPFNSTHAQTIADVATQIQSKAAVVSAVASAVPRTITIIAADPTVDVVISDVVVAAGSQQAVGTFAESEAAKPTTQRGSFRASADNTTAAALAASARYLTSAAADDFAVLEVNF